MWKNLLSENFACNDDYSIFQTCLPTLVIRWAVWNSFKSFFWLHSAIDYFRDLFLKLNYSVSLTGSFFNFFSFLSNLHIAFLRPTLRKREIMRFKWWQQLFFAKDHWLHYYSSSFRLKRASLRFHSSQLIVWPKAFQNADRSAYQVTFLNPSREMIGAMFSFIYSTFWHVIAFTILIDAT